MLCISVLLAEKMIFFRRVIYNFPVFQLLSLRNLKKKKNIKGKRDHVRKKTSMCTLSSENRLHGHSWKSISDVYVAFDA